MFLNSLNTISFNPTPQCCNFSFMKYNFQSLIVYSTNLCAFFTVFMTTDMPFIGDV